MGRGGGGRGGGAGELGGRDNHFASVKKLRKRKSTESRIRSLETMGASQMEKRWKGFYASRKYYFTDALGHTTSQLGGGEQKGHLKIRYPA